MGAPSESTHRDGAALPVWRRPQARGLCALAGLYVAFHLATLSTSRLPWFDDTFFSSVADSLLRTGEFELAASPLWIHQVYLYGPVYFLILGGVFEQLGLGLVQARLPGLLAGFGILAVGFGILRGARVPPGLAAATCGLLALDPTFHQNIHSGRMDSTALLFLLLSFLSFQSAATRSGRAAAVAIAASALFAALGVLTTPRPGYLLIPLGGLLLARWLRRPDREASGQLLLFGAVFALPIGAWIAYAFGSIPAMLQYYAGFSDDYASGGFGIRALHAPVLVPLVVLSAYAARTDSRILRSELVVFTLAGIASYYLFVKDKGTYGGLYAFFMVPLAYLALGVLTSSLLEATQRAAAVRWLQLGIFGGLLAFNGAVFLARTTLEVAQRGSRSPATAEAAIARLIPPGSRVVGDDKFYFAVRRAQSDFQYAQRGGTLDERVRYHRDVYDVQYLITNEGENPGILEAYERELPLVPIGTVESPPDGALARAITAVAQKAGLGTSLTASYAGSVFVRAPEGRKAP